MTPLPQAPAPRTGPNLPIAALSLIISLLLWSVRFAENSKPMVTRAFTVALQADGLKDGLSVTRLPETVSVAVTASEQRFARFRPDSFAALIDLSRAIPGTQAYPIQIFPPEVREFMTPASLTARVEIEPVASRSLGVDVETKGELTDAALQIRDLTPDPLRAKVTGPKGQVDAVRRIRGFLDLGSTAVTAGSAVEVPLEALDARGRPLDRVRTEPLFARVRIALATVPEEKTVFVVPNFRGAPAPGHIAQSYTITPNSVTVRGPSGTLAGFTKLPTESVDLTGSLADGEFTVGLRLPPGVRAVGPAQVRVRVKIIRAQISPPPVSPPPPVN